MILNNQILDGIDDDLSEGNIANKLLNKIVPKSNPFKNKKNKGIIYKILFLN